MTGVLKKLARWLRRARSDQRGTATLEFVIVFPPIILLLVMSVEASAMLTRQAMLDRGLDIAVRNVRLGVNPVLGHQDLKQWVCDASPSIPNCSDRVKIELETRDPFAWTPPDPTPDCIDEDEPMAPVRTFVPGNANELMLVRACVLFEPLFPGAALGKQMKIRNEKYYGLVSTAAFVNEPR